MTLLQVGTQDYQKSRNFNAKSRQFCLIKIGINLGGGSIRVGNNTRAMHIPMPNEDQLNCRLGRANF